MDVIADIVMLLWLPAVVVLFSVVSPARAVIAAYLFAWLFLPNQEYPLPGLPDYTKMSATTAGVLLGGAINASSYFVRFRFSAVDLPMALYFLSPFVSSTVNGLGMYDGISSTLDAMATWTLPYLMGRIFITTRHAIQELAIGVFVAGLIYVPLCLFEVRMSPQLHKMIYGYASFGWEGYRLGGWRPRVFMKTGLMLSMWMAMCSLVGIWLLKGSGLRKLRGYPMWWLVAALFVTTLLCRSTGAVILLTCGAAVLWVTRSTRSKIALVTLLLISPAYIVVRVAGVWDGSIVSNLAAEFDAERAQSFQFRLDNEDMLVAKAMQSPIFGWGGWGRARVYDEQGKDISITDGLWIIELGSHGLLGLTALYTVLLIPLGLLLWNVPTRQLNSPGSAPALVLAVCVTLYAIDGLPNAMVNPVFMLMAGGVVAWASTRDGLASTATGLPNRIMSTKSRMRLAVRRLHPGSM